MLRLKAKQMVITIGLMLFIVNVLAYSQEASVVLKKGKRIEGTVLQEAPEFILLETDFGEVKVKRSDIERLSYLSTVPKTEAVIDAVSLTNENQVNGENLLNDRVVVYWKDGDVKDGFLLAKSLSMVMLDTDIGRLTVPKRDIKMIEYVSSAYSERGEPVKVILDNGSKLEGSIFHEDESSLTMNTNMGRLTINKLNLRSMEYLETIPEAVLKSTKKRESQMGFTSVGTVDETPAILREGLAISQLPRSDVFDIGYSTSFGPDYSPGLTIGYTSRFPFKSFRSFSLGLEANLNLALFSLNKDAFEVSTSQTSANVSGNAIITTIGAGMPVQFYPKGGTSYQFFYTPSLEGHVIYKSLVQTFPSFPALNSEIQETKFNFGMGNRVGLEWVAKNWRAGLAYNVHLIMGEDDFSSISLYLVKKIF